MATGSLASQLREKRSQMMIEEVERAAVRLFEARGFGEVTVEQIAAEAQISVRTFYRYFPAKEDVLQVQIDRRSGTLRALLDARPLDEPPLQSLRLAFVELISAEDPEVLRRWISVIHATPGVLKSVLGGIQLKIQPVMREFLQSRLGLPPEALAPTMLAAAAGGVIQAAQIHWYFDGGDLATSVTAGLGLLERGLGGDPRTWQVLSG
jgi:TetR/AcrR family transcriptional regulator, regulator of mycofactocin system